MDDAIEVARHGPEAVVGRHATVVEILDLLQHRDRARARRRRRPGRNSTGRRLTCAVRRRGDEVGRAGADRRRARHHPPAEVRLRVGDRRVRHRLLVVRAIGRQLRAVPIQRLAHARDVAVAEDRPDAAEQRHLAPVVHRALRGEVADQRLRHRQPGFVLIGCSLPCARAPRVDQRLEVLARTPATERPSSSIASASHARAGSPKIVRPTAKPRHVRLPAASAKPRASSSIGAFSPSSTTPRQYGSRSAISASSAGHASRAWRRAASTTRGRCRGCRGASARAARRPARRGRRFGGMISSSSS